MATILCLPESLVFLSIYGLTPVNEWRLLLQVAAKNGPRLMSGLHQTARPSRTMVVAVRFTLYILQAVLGYLFLLVSPST